MKLKWQRRQKLWARAPFGYITMMALPLGTNNCFGFGFVFGFGFGFGFRLRLRRLFSVPVCFRVWVFLCEESFGRRVPLVAHANRLRRAPKCNCAQVCQQTFTVSSLSVMATNECCAVAAAAPRHLTAAPTATVDCVACPATDASSYNNIRQRQRQHSDVSVSGSSSSSSNNNNKATPTKVKREANSEPRTTTTTTATRDNNNIHTLLTTIAVKRVS